MRLYYEDTDITDFVSIKRCVHRDFSGARTDSLAIELENAAQWHAWGPKRDDRIVATLGGYETGTMYIDTITPEDGRYQIMATSLPSYARQKKWGSFENQTLAQIMRACAAECGMGWTVYGLDERALYPYLVRRNEGCAAFLERLMEWEGAKLKCVNGKLCGIGIKYAQERDARQLMELTADQSGIAHRKRSGFQYAGLTVRTPYAEAEARDTQADTTDHPILTDLPAQNVILAARWARGMLLKRNREAEELVVSSAFNPEMSAMIRIDVESAADATGEWIVDRAEHDLTDEKTTARLLRCVSSIW